MIGYGDFFAHEAGQPVADDIAVLTGCDREAIVPKESFSSPRLFEPALIREPVRTVCHWPCRLPGHFHFELDESERLNTDA